MGVLKLKKDTLRIITSSMWDKGKVIALELAEQKAQFIAGAGLLFISFLAQMAARFLPPTVSTPPLEVKLTEAGFGVGLALMLGVSAYFAYRLYRANLIKAVEAAAEAQT